MTFGPGFHYSKIYGRSRAINCFQTYRSIPNAPRTSQKPTAQTFGRFARHFIYKVSQRQKACALGLCAFCLWSVIKLMQAWQPFGICPPCICALFLYFLLRVFVVSSAAPVNARSLKPRACVLAANHILVALRAVFI